MNLINIRCTDDSLKFGKLSSNDFCERSNDDLDTDASRLEIAFNQIITAQTVLRALADRVNLDQPRDALNELADRLDDAVSDTIKPVMSALTEELQTREM